MTEKKIKIEIFMNYACLSEPKLRENLKTAIEIEGLEDEVEIIFKRLPPKEAEKLGLRGSPTVKINGEEIQPISQGGFT